MDLIQTASQNALNALKNKSVMKSTMTNATAKPQKLFQQIIEEEGQEQERPNAQFSVFAHMKEVQMKERQKYIQRVIKQALESHFQAIRKHTQNEVSIIRQHTNCRNEIYGLLGKVIDLKNIENIQQFIKNPIKQIAKQQMIEKQGIQYLRQFLIILKKLQQYSLVENKLIRQNKIMMSQYLKYQNSLLIPTALNPQTFIKAVDGKLNYIFKHGTNFMERDILMKLHPVQRQNIMNMVFLFLKEKKIIVTIDEINSKIDKLKNDQSKHF